MTIHQFRRRIFEVLQPARFGDWASLVCDIGIQICILISVFFAYLVTFDWAMPYQHQIQTIDAVIIYVFTAELLLRILTADFLFPDSSKAKSVWRFLHSPMTIIDILAILPFYLPLIFPCPLTFLRMLRLLRLLRLGKLGRYTHALQTVFVIIQAKAKELIASIMVTSILLVISSLLIYYAEHDAQPETFQNAFSGLWWAIATLTTIGYGDIYPITVPGKILAACIALLGIGLVAIPASILSGAYMEFLSRQKSANETVPNFCPYCGKKLPH